jgi:hypothetical protein
MGGQQMELEEEVLKSEETQAKDQHTGNSKVEREGSNDGRGSWSG